MINMRSMIEATRKETVISMARVPWAMNFPMKSKRARKNKTLKLLRLLHNRKGILPKNRMPTIKPETIRSL
jgi:hypothetical protein